MKFTILVILVVFSFSVNANNNADNNSKLTISYVRGELSFIRPKACSFDDGGSGEWTVAMLLCKGTMPIQIMSSKLNNDITIEKYNSSLIKGLDANASNFRTDVEITKIKSKLIVAQKSFEFVYNDTPDQLFKSESIKIEGKKYFYFINIMAPVADWASWKNYVVFTEYLEIE